MNMMTISKSIGDVLYNKGIFGHVTVDLVSFPDPTSPQAHPLFWAVDLNCGLTDYSAACLFFDFLMDGKLDQFTGKYQIDNNAFNGNDSVSSASKSKASSYRRDSTEQRTFMYCRYLHHPGLAAIQYKSFFHMCRLESVSFDLERRQGATFMLQDCLQSGVIAMMTIAEDRKESLQMMIDAFRFLESQAGALSKLRAGGVDEARTDELDLTDVVSAVRLLYKALVKREEKDKLAARRR